MQIVSAFATLEATGTDIRPMSMVSPNILAIFRVDKSSLDPQEARLSAGKTRISVPASPIFWTAIGASMIRTIWKGA
jgi:hypothetical protein